MGWGRRLTIGLSLFLMFGFIQILGGYLVEQLQQEREPISSIEEKVIQQKVLQLEPVEYYTVQVGTYQTATEGQKKINELANAGYRVCVSQESPYQLWLGCFGKEPQLTQLPAIIKDSRDVFVKKKILNETAFCFPETEQESMESLATLFSSLHVTLCHSLQMFQDYRYDACEAQTWGNMITQIVDELTLIQQRVDIILEESEWNSVESALRQLSDKIRSYQEHLDLVVEKESDQAVLLAQSCLLELIEQYHQCMKQCSVNI